jgi:hypothetical protein
MPRLPFVLIALTDILRLCFHSGGAAFHVRRYMQQNTPSAAFAGDGVLLDKVLWPQVRFYRKYHFFPAPGLQPGVGFFRKVVGAGRSCRGHCRTKIAHRNAKIGGRKE